MGLLDIVGERGEVY